MSKEYDGLAAIYCKDCNSYLGTSLKGSWALCQNCSRKKKKDVWSQARK